MLSNNLSIRKIRNDDIILAQLELFTWGNGGDNEPNMTESPNFYVVIAISCIVSYCLFVPARLKKALFESLMNSKSSQQDTHRTNT